MISRVATACSSVAAVRSRCRRRMAHVMLLVVDATEGMIGSDATVAGYAHEEGRALIICVNKWDASPDKDRRKFTQEVRDDEVSGVRAGGVYFGEDRRRREEPLRNGVERVSGGFQAQR